MIEVSSALGKITPFILFITWKSFFFFFGLFQLSCLPSEALALEGGASALPFENLMRAAILNNHWSPLEAPCEHEAGHEKSKGYDDYDASYD
jgi:hypothetical protein